METKTLSFHNSKQSSVQALSFISPSLSPNSIERARELESLRAGSNGGAEAGGDRLPLLSLPSPSQTSIHGAVPSLQTLEASQASNARNPFDEMGRSSAHRFPAPPLLPRPSFPSLRPLPASSSLRRSLPPPSSPLLPGWLPRLLVFCSLFFGFLGFFVLGFFWFLFGLDSWSGGAFLGRWCEEGL